MSYHAAFHRRLTEHGYSLSRVPVVDAHLHVVDFVQDGDGLAALLRAMDAGRVTRAVVFGLPVKKKWEAFEKVPPHYYLDDNSRCYYFPQTDEILALDYASLPARQQTRLAPLLCGFNPTDKSAARDVERTLDRYPIWRGVGEILCRHDDLTNLTNEEVARANHPALFEVYELCGRRGLPVLIHQNSTSVAHHDDYEYLEEMVEAVAAFPRTTFVWAHGGISRRVTHKRYHEMIAAVLAGYPNVFVDLSWVAYDDVVCQALEPKAHWLELIRKQPGRFCLGSDLCGHFDHLGKALARYNGLLERLPAQARDQVARGTAERLWFRPRKPVRTAA